MKKVESHRRLLNKQQTELRRMLMSFNQHDKAIHLFLNQHAMLHSAKMAQTELWSYEDEVLDDMVCEQIRRIPQNCEHTVAWCVWHIARIEDVTMNLLVAGSPQLLHQDNWLKRMNVTVSDTGNTMCKKSVANLSKMVDIEALRAYRIAVGRRTREIVVQLTPDELKQKIDPFRLQKVRQKRAVVDEASGIIDYWGKRTIAGLLLMPATRHNLVHLNEALRLKRSRQ
jgi:hypothetical protein